MCRHLGYLGAPQPVGEMLTRGVHSLYTQAWAPRDMRNGGRINADGFGVAWWPRRGAAATGYRNQAPIWTDPAVTEVLPQIESSAILAAVRSATVGMPVERSACAPFVDGPWAFSHNGMVPDWHTVLGPSVAADGAPLRLAAVTDSAALWLLLRRRLATVPPTNALRDLVAAVLAAAPEARLNLLLGDGETIWATTCYHALSVLVDDAGTTVASEPYDDDPRWQAVPDHSLVTARPGQLLIEQLDIDDNRSKRS